MPSQEDMVENTDKGAGEGESDLPSRGEMVENTDMGGGDSLI